ncbi:MAG: hypothetical protein ACRD4E_16090, partial [Bryobacteraceae bacterium]
DLHGSGSLTKIGQALQLSRSADRSVPQNVLKRLRDRQILIQADTGSCRFEDEASRSGCSRSVREINKSLPVALRRARWNLLTRPFAPRRTP